MPALNFYYKFFVNFSSNFKFHFYIMITIFNTLNFKGSSLKKCTISIALCAAISALNGADVNLEGVSVEDSADDGYRATTSEVGKTNTPILEIPQTVNVVTTQ